MFQFFIIKNGLRLIHSFAAISWNPITVTAQTTSDADSQTARKKYCCTSNALIFPSGKHNSFIYTVWVLSTKLCTIKIYMDSYTGSGLLGGAGFFLFRELQFDIGHGPMLRHHWNVSLSIAGGSLPLASCRRRTHMALPIPYPHPADPSTALSWLAFIFQVNLFSQAHQFSLETPWGSSRVGNDVYIFARHSA